MLLSLIASSALAQWPSLSEPLPRQGNGDKDAALIVSIENYAFLPGIPGAQENAAAWFQHLVKTRGIPVSQVKWLQNNEAALESIRKELTFTVSRVKPGGVLWVVFIGHGAPSEDGSDGLLVGADAQNVMESFAARSLKRSELLSTLEAGQQKASVVLLDSCFSGQSPTGELLVKGAMPTLPERETQVTAKKTVLVLSAGTSRQVAGALPGKEVPAFSYLALGGLRGWADENHDGKVTAGEVVGFTRSVMGTTLTGRTQTPTLNPETAADISVGKAKAGEELPLAEIVLWLKGAVRGSRATVEPPPDAEFTQARGAASDAELSFRSGVEIRVPRISVAPTGSLNRLNIQAEQLLEQAQDASDAQSNAPELKAELWCRLAVLKPNNPYAEQAEEGCAMWRSYGLQMRERETRLAEDYQTLAGYLQLRRKNRDQKRGAISAFLATYGAITSDSRVKAVAEAMKQIEDGGEAQLRDQSDVLTKSCEGGEARDCEILGVLRLKGSHPFLTPEPVVAVGLFKKACDASPRFGCTMLGTMKLEGRGGAADSDAARLAFERGCLGGDAAGCRALVPIADGELRSGDWLAKACVAGDQSSCVGLARALVGLESKTYGVKVDGERGVRLADRACRTGESNGCMTLGDSLRLLAGAARNGPDAAFEGGSQARAASAYERACVLGRVDGCSKASELLSTMGEKARQSRVDERWCALAPGDCLEPSSTPVLAAVEVPVAAQSGDEIPSLRAKLTPTDPSNDKRGKTFGIAFTTAGAVLLAGGVVAHIGAGVAVGQVRLGGIPTGTDIGKKLGEAQVLEVFGWIGLGSGAICGALGLFDLLRQNDSRGSSASTQVSFVPSVSGLAVVISGALQ